MESSYKGSEISVLKLTYIYSIFVFAFDNKVDYYKVVGVFFYYVRHVCESWIYRFFFGRWRRNNLLFGRWRRVIDFPFEPLNSFPPPFYGIYNNGALYWLTVHLLRILAFDLARADYRDA